VLHDISLSINGGELVTLVGPSGCGKTSLLKIIAGLLRPTRGDVYFDEQPITHLPTERRGVGVVFQKPLLFPYLNVCENVAFGLKTRTSSKQEITRRVEAALRMVQLEDFVARHPKELSGGQEQRVALARALVTEPRVLLLDEPFSALDENLRAEMRALVRHLQRQLKITTLFITHDQAEAVSIADHIALIFDGAIEQIGEPRDFYTVPLTARAARFFGWTLLEGVRRGARIETASGNFNVPYSRDAGTASDGFRVVVAFHPAHTRIVEAAERGQHGANFFGGTLDDIVDLGTPEVRYRIRLNSGEAVEVEDRSSMKFDRAKLKIGADVILHIPETAIRVFH
jgi:ABC-type Fe3+/spermidine/putrescine transport system ATPase subunit